MIGVTPSKASIEMIELFSFQFEKGIFISNRKEKSKKEETNHTTLLGALVYFNQRKIKVNRKIFNERKIEILI